MSAPLRDAARAYLVVGGLAFAATRARHVPWIGAHVHLLVGALFLVSAIHLAQRAPGGLRGHGIDLAGLLDPVDDGLPPGPLGLWELGRALRRALPAALRETAVGVVACLVIFPPFAIGFRHYHDLSGPFALSLPPALLDTALTQLLVVALPEEAFFRGYLQTRLDAALPSERGVLGAPISARALGLSALLFALLHFAVEPRPDRLAVFFPGLVFGWLRAARGGIGAAVVFHAASNVFSEILARGWPT